MVHGCVVCGCVNGLCTIMCMCTAVEGLKKVILSRDLSSTGIGQCWYRSHQPVQ